MNKDELIGKYIFMDGEEYEVEETLGVGYWYKVRNINTDRFIKVSEELVTKKVKTYEEDLEKFENENNNKDYNFVKMSIDAKITNTENKLLKTMELLSRILSETEGYVNKCKEKDIDYSINELGIIQAKGNEIDVLCSKLMTLKEIRNELEE
jgi:hypothetical protein